MKLRIKYAKTGRLKFIGHLDVMRYFQKAIRRAGLDVAYSQGFNPHQLITFAAPLGLGVTSEGEYFDGEFHSATTTEDMVNRLNAVMAEDMRVLDVRLLPDKAKTAMAVVSASDYLVSVRSGYYMAEIDRLFGRFQDFLEQKQIEIIKKTKKSEQLTDIRGMVLEAHISAAQSFYMKLATGSIANLKPELVMEAYCNFLGISYEPFGFQVHRLETYMDGEQGELISLAAAGDILV